MPACAVSGPGSGQGAGQLGAALLPGPRPLIPLTLPLSPAGGCRRLGCSQVGSRGALGTHIAAVCWEHWRHWVALRVLGVGAGRDGGCGEVLGVRWGCTLVWASGQYWVLLEALGALGVSTGGTGESTGALGFGTGSWYLVVLQAWGRGRTLQGTLGVVVDDTGPYWERFSRYRGQRGWCQPPLGSPGRRWCQCGEVRGYTGGSTGHAGGGEGPYWGQYWGQYWGRRRAVLGELGWLLPPPGGRVGRCTSPAVRGGTGDSAGGVGTRGHWALLGTPGGVLAGPGDAGGRGVGHRGVTGMSLGTLSLIGVATVAALGTREGGTGGPRTLGRGTERPGDIGGVAVVGVGARGWHWGAPGHWARFFGGTYLRTHGGGNGIAWGHWGDTGISPWGVLLGLGTLGMVLGHPLRALCKCCWRRLGTLQRVMLGWLGDTGSVLEGGWGH